VVPQYHKYRGTTVRYLPTKSHFSEDFRAKNQFIHAVNKLEVCKLHRRYFVQLVTVRWVYCPAKTRLMLLRCAVLCHHVSDSNLSLTLPPIRGQSFNFPTFSPKIGWSNPLHILHRVYPKNPESFVKVSRTVSEIFGILLSDPVAYLQKYTTRTESLDTPPQRVKNTYQYPRNLSSKRILFRDCPSCL